MIGKRRGNFEHQTPKILNSKVHELRANKYIFCNPESPKPHVQTIYPMTKDPDALLHSKVPKNWDQALLSILGMRWNHYMIECKKNEEIIL